MEEESDGSPLSKQLSENTADGGRQRRRRAKPQSAQAQSFDFLETVGEPGLTVHIVGARGLRNADWLPGSGKSDTYAVLKMRGRQLHRTKTVQDTLEPYWREQVDIPDWTPDTPLGFTIYDEDSASSDYLGKVDLQPAVFAQDGFNGEVSILEAGRGVQAYLRLKIKVAGKELPPGPPMELQIRADKGNHATWGLDLDTQDNELLFVTEVRPGPFLDANLRLAPEAQIIKSDFLLRVNGVKGSPAALLNEFKRSLTVTLDLSRGVSTTICFDYKNTSLPLGMLFPKKPSGEALVVLAVDKGSAAAAYNAENENEMLKILPGDRILAVAGFRGMAGDLLLKMEAFKSGQVQLEIIRPTGQVAKEHFGLV